MAIGTFAGDRRALFSLVAGGLYIVIGALQVVAGAGLEGRWSELLMLSGGAPDGVVLVLIGAVFVQGYLELGRGLREGVAFTYMGIALALFFLLLELARVGAALMGLALIGGPDYEGFTVLGSVSPSLYLAMLPLAGYWSWRPGFSLLPRGVRGNGDKDLNNVEGGLR